MHGSFLLDQSTTALLFPRFFFTFLWVRGINNSLSPDWLARLQSPIKIEQLSSPPIRGATKNNRVAFPALSFLWVIGINDNLFPDWLALLQSPPKHDSFPLRQSEVQLKTTACFFPRLILPHCSKVSFGWNVMSLEVASTYLYFKKYFSQKLPMQMHYWLYTKRKNIYGTNWVTANVFIQYTIVIFFNLIHSRRHPRGLLFLFP